ncbi:hypothetical protein SBD_5600 [Streptomyces bottropensis ATCC 25435]|uniref:Uncharacterized protein n=1 Tax=Streptomyces bottropensis ATCC 25435 TaxID=1054862 RepID=M3FKC1_9ACTN|nr:hypothetical protein SBD_5600 [Streptomyces bottropensis ATCC 25435]
MLRHPRLHRGGSRLRGRRRDRRELGRRRVVGGRRRSGGLRRGRARLVRRGRRGGSGSFHRHGRCGRGRGYRGALVLGAHSFSPRSTASAGRWSTSAVDCSWSHVGPCASCMGSAFPTSRQGTISGACGSGTILYVGSIGLMEHTVRTNPVVHGHHPHAYPVTVAP